MHFFYLKKQVKNNRILKNKEGSKDYNLFLPDTKLREDTCLPAEWQVRQTSLFKIYLPMQENEMIENELFTIGEVQKDVHFRNYIF